MTIIDNTDRFVDNSYKYKKRILLHWTGGSTAEGAINWLDKRLGGKGTVGYNYIIDKDGLVYMLADHKTRYMQSSGLGKKYDEETVAISFASLGEYPTVEQLVSCQKLIMEIKKDFDIFEITHHAAVNSHKKDFPSDYWERLKIDLNLS